MSKLFIQSDIGFTAEERAGSILDYGLDWGPEMAKSPGDLITSNDWTTDSALVLTQKSHSATITSVRIEVPDGMTDGWYTLENKIVTQGGLKDSRTCLLYVKPTASAGSALFPNRLVALVKLRRDRLVLLAGSILPGVVVSDEFLWDKLQAAEAEMAHRLRVPLGPTQFFPADPTSEQLAALPAGMPWQIDPAYDYDPDNFFGDKWGMISTRIKPIIRINSLKFQYPSPAQTIVDVPADWIRADKRYGQVQIVPTGTQYQTLLGGLFMSSISGGRQLPFTIALQYVAGLENAARDYPDLIDAVMKLAVVKVIEDAFLPQSGSISADGLSQSVSVDTGKYSEMVDRIINGEAGSNGGLMARIHGIRVTAI